MEGKLLLHLFLRNLGRSDQRAEPGDCSETADVGFAAAVAAAVAAVAAAVAVAVAAAVAVAVAAACVAASDAAVSSCSQG